MTVALVPLSQVAKLLSGGTPSKANLDLWTGNVPWLTPKDMSRWSGRTEETVSESAVGRGTKLAPANASLVAVRGMSLHNEIRIIHSERPLTFNQDVKAVVAKEGFDPVFLYYALMAQKPQLLEWVSSSSHGTGVLDTDRLNSLLVPDIALNDQAVVVNVFRSLDDKIELNRRMNETLEGMAQAIFRDWFIDFGPVRRKQAGATDPVEIMGVVTRNPERAAELAALFPDALDDDGRPMGWAPCQVSELVEFNPKQPLKKGAIAPYSDMSSLPTSGSTAEAPVLREYSSGMRFCNGDALMARITPCLENGKTAFVDFLSGHNPVGWGSTEFIVIRGILGTPPPFGYLLCRHPEFREQAIQSMTGTSGRQRAQTDSLMAWSIAKPTPAVLHAFGELVVPVFDRISAAGLENRTLAETLDYLLPRLMSGAVRVVPNQTAGRDLETG